MKRPISQPGGRRRFPAGFTLVELLVVLALFVILMAIAAPVTTSMVENDNLTSAGQIVADQIALALQIASAKNQTVEVRLIQEPDISANGYCAMQLWTASLSGSSNDTPVMSAASRLITLPQTAISFYSSATNLSELLSTSNDNLSGTMPVGTISNASYVAFQMTPSGVVAPAVPMSNCYLSIVPARLAGGAAFPANYVNVQINPYTGTVLVYRP